MRTTKGRRVAVVVGLLALALGGVAIAIVPAIRANGLQITSLGSSTIAATKAGVWVKSTTPPTLRYEDGTNANLVPAAVLTTKGDLVGFTGTIFGRHPIGSNDQVLTADSAQTHGIKWAAAATGTVTSVTCGTGLTCTAANPIITTGTVTLANTAVTPASYTVASITVDAQGRLTAASSGSANPAGQTSTTGTVQTTDNTLTTAITITPADGKTVSVFADCAGRKDDGAQAGAFLVHARGRRAGAATTVTSSTLSELDSDDTMWTADAAESGTGLLIRVRGNTGDTVDWVCAAQIVTTP